MVKLSWLEELVIKAIIAILVVFFLNFVQNLIGIYPLWVWIILWFLLYIGISNIVIKIIKGKDKKKNSRG